MKLECTALSIHEIGKRQNQEDSIYPEYTGAPSKSDLFILCDGMGGHDKGEVASACVCKTMSEYVKSHPTEDGSYGEEDFKAALKAAYDALDAIDSGDSEKKMGTTLCFVKLHTKGVFVAHIGDSRIYQFRPSESSILYKSRDHSLVNELVELGELTPQEARTSSRKNVITRAMQPGQEPRDKADWRNLTDIEPGDYFYVCSDGMLEISEDEDILNVISMDDKSDSQKIAILRSVTQDNADNHSAHLIHIIKAAKNGFSLFWPFRH